MIMTRIYSDFLSVSITTYCVSFSKTLGIGLLELRARHASVIEWISELLVFQIIPVYSHLLGENWFCRMPFLSCDSYKMLNDH